MCKILLSRLCAILLFFFAVFLPSQLQAQGQGGDLWSLAPIGGKIRGFDLPLRNAQGVETGRLKGLEAVILDRFQVQVADLIYQSRAGAETEVFLHIANGIYNRDTESLTSEGTVLIRRDNLEISGNGLSWKIREQKGTIHDSVRVVISATAGPSNSIAEERYQ